MSLPILHSSARFLVVDKPAGWLSVPGRDTTDPSIQAALSQELCGQVWPVHRLDREVSGLILFAKDAKAHREANSWFEQRRVHKFYEAWTEVGAPGVSAERSRDPHREGAVEEWTSKLLRGKRRAYESPHGKPAQTRVQWLGPGRWLDAPVQRWLVEPLTGRPHQIRCEFFRHGYPILGDTLYGASGQFLADSIALRAVRLDFSDCPSARDLGLPERIEAKGLEAYAAEAYGAR